jgi:hypothetical protein
LDNGNAEPAQKRSVVQIDDAALNAARGDIE